MGVTTVVVVVVVVGRSTGCRRSDGCSGGRGPDRLGGCQGCGGRGPDVVAGNDGIVAWLLMIDQSFGFGNGKNVSVGRRLLEQQARVTS